MMTTLTARFGTIEYGELDVVTFPLGLPGFENHRRFVIINHKDGSPFRWLQSVEDGALAFLVVDPATFFSDYAPEMDESDSQFLSLTETTPRLVYTIVTIPKGNPEAMTLNLAGPIVVNAQNRVAKQIVLTDESFGIRHPIPKAESPEAVAA